MKKQTTILLFIAFIILMGACAEVGKDPLVGRWEREGGLTKSIEFFADGTLIVDGLIPTGGTWKRLDDGRVKVEMDSVITIAVVYKVKIYRDIATFTEANGTVSEFERVK